MVDAFLGALMASSSTIFMWNVIGPFSVTLFDQAGPDSLNWVITLVSPHVLPYIPDFDENMVARWAAAVSAVPYTEEVSRCGVDALLQIASRPYLRQHIPIGSWVLLNERPSLPPQCRGRSKGTSEDVVRQVRVLGDIEILKSYLLLVWSEWNTLFYWSGGFEGMQGSIREDFGGIGMGRHREDLIKRLDHILGRLDQGLEYLKQEKPSIDEDEVRLATEQYGRLKEVLLEVDREAMRTLARTPSRLITLLLYSPQRPSPESHSTFVCALPPLCL
jgi:hypothetical protein